jgi:biotin operon repressor
VKGKPWSVEEEKRLRKLVAAGNGFNAISRELKKSPEAVRAKMERLGLVVDKQQGTGSRLSTSNVILPEELISAEDALKMLVGALKMACTPGLSRVEVQRLQVVATLARIYSEKLTEYLDLRGLEQRLFELEGKYAELAKKAKGNRSSE